MRQTVKSWLRNGQSRFSNEQNTGLHYLYDAHCSRFVLTSSQTQSKLQDIAVGKLRNVFLDLNESLLHSYIMKNCYIKSIQVLCGRRSDEKIPLCWTTRNLELHGPPMKMFYLLFYYRFCIDLLLLTIESSFLKNSEVTSSFLKKVLRNLVGVRRLHENGNEPQFLLFPRNIEMTKLISYAHDLRASDVNSSCTSAQFQDSHTHCFVSRQTREHYHLFILTKNQQVFVQIMTMQTHWQKRLLYKY